MGPSPGSEIENLEKAGSIENGGARSASHPKTPLAVLHDGFELRGISRLGNQCERKLLGECQHSPEQDCRDQHAATEHIEYCVTLRAQSQYVKYIGSQWERRLRAAGFARSLANPEA
jgi:hypothetical protein